ncbi:hypothetical protein AK830_g9028 [Neonectria ditissima]|uniref:Thymocyte nuclear protein 1 n=1 Tax=Neonectria ditissima TaxID=78410 RepID=A0A0P7B6J6_9HYPO|nr:hypothetical protein AK830_g9028 [Neonectria ditissima]
MPPQKQNRSGDGSAAAEEALPIRRSLRSATVRNGQATAEAVKPAKPRTKKRSAQDDDDAESKPTQELKPTAKSRKKPTKKPTKKPAKAARNSDSEEADDPTSAPGPSAPVSEDVDVDSIPTENPNAPKHDGEWYWLMKAEPETRLENGIDVRFSIDDLRAKKKPEGWDGIRAYPARNNMRNMNAGDKAFFYHSNCKEPSIVGIMEIVKEYSEDVTARQPGTPYYDPSSTKDKPKWDLVHVEFRKKFAVKITLKELRELGKPGGPLENMQMLKQSRLSVSKVSEAEWKALCDFADKKAKDAGLEHEED